MSKQSAKSNKNKSGLLNNSKPIFLAIAKINKPHGLRGEVSVELLTDFPDRLVHTRNVYVGKSKTLFKINTVRKANRNYLISFMDYNYRDTIEHLRNKLIYIKSSEIPDLEKDEYYHHELMGIQVINNKQKVIGEISEIIKTGANDVYVIKSVDPEKKEILIPAIKSVVKSIDIQQGKMVIELPEWR